MDVISPNYFYFTYESSNSCFIDFSHATCINKSLHYSVDINWNIFIILIYARHKDSKFYLTINNVLWWKSLLNIGTRTFNEIFCLRFMIRE